jgi:hypothetical protein
LVDTVIKAVAGKQVLAEAVKYYEDEMRARGAEEVQLTYQQMLLTAEGRFGESALSRIGFNRE